MYIRLCSGGVEWLGTCISVRIFTGAYCILCLRDGRLGKRRLRANAGETHNALARAYVPACIHLSLAPKCERGCVCVRECVRAFVYERLGPDLGILSFPQKKLSVRGGITGPVVGARPRNLESQALGTRGIQALLCKIYTKAYKRCPGRLERLGSRSRERN